MHGNEVTQEILTEHWYQAVMTAAAEKISVSKWLAESNIRLSKTHRRVLRNAVAARSFDHGGAMFRIQKPNKKPVPVFHRSEIEEVVRKLSPRGARSSISDIEAGCARMADATDWAKHPSCATAAEFLQFHARHWSVRLRMRAWKRFVQYEREAAARSIQYTADLNSALVCDELVHPWSVLEAKVADLVCR